MTSSIIAAFLVLLFTVGLPLARGMGMMHSRVLEAESVINFKTTYSANGSTNYLNIKGVASDSAYGIKNIACNVLGDKMVIKVYMGLFSEDSGYLDYTVVVPESVNEVRLGNKLKKIWERKYAKGAPIK